MRTLVSVLVWLTLACAASWAAKPLEIYFIDVEGGQATLIVSPTGQSLLVDAGWPGFEGRDAGRILAAAKRAGVTRIDYMLMTHYHLDHVGGIPPLVARIPVGAFVDHGSNTESGKNADALSAAYAKAVENAKRLVVKPGDRIPVKGLRIDVVAARGETIHGGGPNKFCEGVAPKGEDKTENARSIGFVLNYGKFRLADLADLTWDKELALMCPANPIGKVDVYLVSHHGMDISNSPALVHALAPRVAISNVGAKKGGAPAAWQVVRKSPGLEDIWQLHMALAAGKDNNAPEEFIANPEGNCKGYGIRLTAEASGAFTVLNERNQLKKEYKPRASR